MEKSNEVMLVPKDPFHQSLESAGIVAQTKRHPIPLEQHERGAECCFALSFSVTGTWWYPAARSKVENQ